MRPFDRHERDALAEAMAREALAIGGHPLARLAMIGSARGFGIGATCSEVVDEEETYPAEEDSPTVFPFVFQELTFTEAAGAQSVTAVDRNATPFYCCSLSGFLEEGAQVLLLRWSNRWWAIPFAATAASAVVYGKVDDEWTEDTATVSIWIDGEDSGDDLSDVEMVPWIPSWVVPEDTWVRCEQIDGTWYAEPRMSVTVQTDEQLDGDTKALQRKRRAAIVLYAGEPGDWKDVCSFVSVTPLNNFQVDGTNKLLQIKTREFFVISPQNESAWGTVHTGTNNCPT